MFILGLFLGGFIGIFLMACLISGKIEDLYYQREKVDIISNKK